MTRPPKLGRVYIVEYFLHVLRTIGDEGVTFSQLQASLIAFRENLYQRKFGQLAGYREDDRARVRRYELTETLGDLLQELAGYGLIRLTYTTPNGGLTELPPRGRRKGRIYGCSLTSEGKALLALAEPSNEEGFYDEFLRLMLRALPQFMSFLVSIHQVNEGGNFIIVPRPTPEKLGLGGLNLGVADGQRRYVEASVADAAQSVEHWMERAVNRDALATFIEERLGRILARRTNPGRKSIIDNVTDSCAWYFLRDFFGDLLWVTDFEVLCSRGAYFEVLGYSDYIPSVNGRVVYLTSWVLPQMELPVDFPENEYDDLTVNTGDGQLIIKRHRPHYADFASTFLDTLVAVYKQFNKTRRTVYVPIPDLRDVVCLRLRISDKIFDHLAAQATRESIARRIPYVISLESDEISYDRSLDRFDRSPLSLSSGSAPKTIACVYAR